MRKISAVEWIIAGSLIVESFLLVNYRQPFFWMILLYGYIRQKNQEKLLQRCLFSSQMIYCKWFIRRNIRLQAKYR